MLPKGPEVKGEFSAAPRNRPAAVDQVGRGKPMTAARVAAVGECMIELSQRDETTLSLAFGGDTLNTAVYLARTTPRDRVAVDYVTALGDDPYSDQMIAMWRGEGIGADHVARLTGRLPGLYIIR